MIFEWMSDPAAWAGLLTLVLLEIVLGIDNLVFIAILADRLPPEQRDRARIIGLSLALVMRLILLSSIAWIVTLTQPIASILNHEVSWRDILLIGGGMFLLFKGTMELHERLAGGHNVKAANAPYAVFWQVIVQIIVLDAVFSLDSVITAVGMVRELSIMVIAVVIAMAVMMLAAKPLMAFVSRHPTVVILCLGFLLMIGFSLIVEGLGFHIPKGYLYAAICFSIMIEAANQIGRRNVRKRVTALDLRDRTARAVLRILKGGQSTPEMGEEMSVIVSSSGGETAFSAQESAMIERVFSLADRPVRSVMVPRVETVWLDIEDPVEDIVKEIRQSGRSRFPVCRGEVDEVLGIVHTKDLLGMEGALDLEAAIRRPLFVMDTLPVLKVLELFKTSTVHMAIVVDEHGAFEGVVTPTDILVALAGDLPELAGENEPDAVRREDGSWLLNGRMPVEEMAHALDIEIEPSDDYATVAGFVLAALQRLPEPGERFEAEGWSFEITELDNHRIDKLVARPVETPAQA